LFQPGAARGPGTRRGPRGADQDERPVALRRRDVLSGRLRRGHRERDGTSGGTQPRLADPVHLVRPGDVGHGRPFRPVPDELPAAEGRLMLTSLRPRWPSIAAAVVAVLYF